MLRNVCYMCTGNTYIRTYSSSEVSQPTGWSSGLDSKSPQSHLLKLDLQHSRAGRRWDLSRGLVIVTDGEPRPFLFCSLEHKVRAVF